MQKIKRGLQEKLNLISKIQNNLKIKKFDIKKLNQKSFVQFPQIQKRQTQQQKQNFCQNSQKIKNPEQEIGTWMNIKKISNQKKQLGFLIPNYSSRKGSFQDSRKQLLNNSYTSRFTSKNSPMKLVQFKTIVQGKKDKNFSAQILRKTYLQRTNRIFYPQKQKQEKLKTLTKLTEVKQLKFFGKLNEFNHVAGSRFKTLDPRFGGLTKEELKQKIKNRSREEEESIINSNRDSMGSTSLNMYQIQVFYNERQRYSSFNRYNFLNSQHTQNLIGKIKKRRNGQTKDRYSPWNNSTEQVLWEQLPKIK